MIILDKFDYEYFIKKQFQLNFVIGVLAILFILTMLRSDLKTYLMLCSLCYLSLSVLLFSQLRRIRTAKSYALHRIFGQLSLSIQFFIITLVFASEACHFFIFGIVIIYILFALTLFVVYKIKFNQSYFDILFKNFEQDEICSLYDLFQKVSNNRWNRMKASKYYLLSSLGFIFAGVLIVIMRNIPIDYTPYFIILINLTLSLYVLCNFFFNVLLPSDFIKKYYL